MLTPYFAFANHGDIGLGQCPDIEEPAVYEMDVNVSDHQYLELVPGETSVTVTVTASISGGRCEVWGYDNGLSNSCELQIGPDYPRLYRVYLYLKQGSSYKLKKVTEQYPASPASVSYDLGPGVHKLLAKAHASDVICDVLQQDTLYKYFTIYVDVPPPTEKDGCCKSSGECKGNPCDASDGNKYQAEIDYQSPVQGLSIERHYNSRNNKDYGLGVGWSTPFLKRLEIGVNALSARRNKGGSEGFIYRNGGWESGVDGSLSLSQTTSGYVLTLPNGDVENYNLQGNVVSETSKGYALAYAYNALNQLESVTNTYGHAITFTYGPDGHITTITTPNSETYQYTYDTFRNLVAVGYPDTHTREYLYESIDLPNSLTGVLDENNVRYATFGYDTASGWATYSQHATTDNGSPQEKHTLAYYLYDGRDVVATDPVGNQELLEFTTRLNVKRLDRSTSYTDNKFFAQTYDSQNNMISRTDEEGIKTQYFYNLENQRVDMTEAADTGEERVTTYGYYSPTIDLITSTTRPSVNPGSQFVTTTTYDADLNLDIITEAGFKPDGTAITRVIDMDFDHDGRIQQIDGPRTDVSDITQFTYYPCSTGNECGQLQSIINALAQVTTFNQYDANGHVTQMTDSLGVVSDFGYDSRGKVASVTQTPPGGVSRITLYTYHSTGLLHTITTPTGAVLTHEYDDAHDLKRITDSLGNKIEYRYDLSGNLISEKIFDPQGGLARAKDTSYDIRNRVATITELGNVTQTVHDAIGNLDNVTDGKNIITDYSYDALRRSLNRTQDLGGSDPATQNALTQYGYDVADRLTQVIDPDAGTTTYQYDDLGNLISTSSPDTGNTTYTYDVAGNVKSKSTAAGSAEIITLSYSYDALNRLTLVTTSDSDASHDITFTYDTCSNGIGRLCTVSNGYSTVSTMYDSFGNVLTHQGITYTYDQSNQIKTTTYPSGAVLSYSYDAAGQINSVDLNVNGQTQSLATSLTYEPFGGIKTLNYGNGKTLTQQWDSAYRLTSQAVPGVLDLAYTLYDANGNLQTRTDTLSSPSTFTYDTLNRLDTAIGDFSNAATWDYNYTKNGNRSLTDEGSPVTLTYEASSNRLDTIGSDDVIIDIAGNTLAKGNWNYSYTPRHRLKDANDGNGVTATFAYNGLGQRVEKNPTNSYGKRFFYGQRGELLTETDENGYPLVEYLYLNGTLLATYHPDTDGDGLTNLVEVEIGGVPVDPDADGDGLIDSDELLIYGTSPSNADTDGDGVSDGNEVLWNTNPLDPNDFILLGDINNDNQVNVADYLLLSRHLLGLAILTSTEQNTADMNQDGQLNVGDMVILSRTIMELAWSNFTDDAVSEILLAAWEELIHAAEAAVTSGELYYVHNDHLGTPQVMTDEGGAVVWKAVYDPFGKATIDGASTVALNVRFPGQYYDPESGLHYNYFRTYNPELGRYITSDPIGLIGGVNTYGYVVGNPISLFDFYGLNPLEAPGSNWGLGSVNVSDPPFTMTIGAGVTIGTTTIGVDTGSDDVQWGQTTQLSLGAGVEICLMPNVCGNGQPVNDNGAHPDNYSIGLGENLGVKYVTRGGGCLKMGPSFGLPFGAGWDTQP